MTATRRQAAGRWSRCRDTLWTGAGAGTVVVPPGARAAVALSPDEHAVWMHLAEPATVAPLASASGLRDEDVRVTLTRLAALGVVDEAT